MKGADRVVKFINKTDTRIWIVLVLSLYFLSFVLKGNEEQYLGYAKKFADPSWMPYSEVFNDFPGTRILFQWITGFFLRHFTFEEVAFWGRLVSYILAAFPLAALIRFLGIPNLWFLFWFPVFYLPQQSLFAGEWMFGPLESKTISYVFVLASLVYLLKGKYILSVILAAIAVNFHLLAGGWYALYLFIYLIFRKIPFRDLLKYAGFFLLMVLPLIVYLYLGLIRDHPSVINGVNLNTIYVYFRNPHHIGLFKSAHYFIHRHLSRVTMAFLVLVFALILHWRKIGGKLGQLNLLVLIILSQVFISLLIALFETSGTFLKYYPFRGNVLAMLLFQLTVLLLLKEFVEKYYPGWVSLHAFFRKWASPLCILGLALLYGSMVYGRIHNRKLETEQVAYIRQLATVLKSKTKPEDKFFMLCETPDYLLALPRTAERNPWVVFRFVPTHNEAIYKWYQRLMLQDSLIANPALLAERPELAKVRAVVTCRPVESPFLYQGGQYGPYYLYFMKPKE